MNFYEFEMDEIEFRELVRNIVDCYEANLHNHGSYAGALAATQAEVIHKAQQDLAELELESLDGGRVIH
jgi:hypothetical protein